MSPHHLLPLLLIACHLAAGGASDDAAELDMRTNALQSAESGGGGAKGERAPDSEERKTLSQQVADGKYGLIQRELFPDGGRSAPGVISYGGNPEVPKDNGENLGGLAREEIWLAEDHLLVLRGGKFDADDGTFPASAQVPPIDDYRAPLRQVKIPSKPKVPPPFPVQLQDDGPIQILAAGPADPRDEPPQTGPQGGHPADATARGVKKYHAGGAAGNSGGGADKATPPPRPSGLDDEDDPSIYYPPPYSFYYPKDNSSAVPPGPLVPGIVLPPPPDFFGRLQPPTTQRPTTTTQRPTTTTQKSTTPKPYLPPVVVTSTPSPAIITQAPKPVYYEYFETNKVRPQAPLRNYISSTAVPLRAFFKAPQRPTQIYYYEEDPSINEVNTPRTQPPRIYIATVARPSNNFEHHISQLRDQIRYQQRQQRYQKRYRQPRPVYQYSFGYEDAIRPTPQPPRYNVQIQPSVDYQRSPQVTPNPLGYQTNYRPVTQSPNYQDYHVPAVTPSSADYRHPGPTPNPVYYAKPDSFFEGITKKYFTSFGQKLTTPAPALHSDLDVNYRRPLPPQNPQAEYFNEGGRGTGEGGPGTFISYRLPGDGAHFYFLTPQLAQQQQRQRNDGNGYYYPVPERRLRRNS